MLDRAGAALAACRESSGVRASAANKKTRKPGGQLSGDAMTDRRIVDRSAVPTSIAVDEPTRRAVDVDAAVRIPVAGHHAGVAKLVGVVVEAPLPKWGIAH